MQVAHKFRGTNVLAVDEPSEPDDTVWENMGIRIANRSGVMILQHDDNAYANALSCMCLPMLLGLMLTLTLTLIGGH